MSDGTTIVETVLNRREVFDIVCRESPDKRDLQEQVTKSRPTVDRAIRELEEENLVNREEGLCKPTVEGRLAYELYEQFEGAFARLSRIENELMELPPETSLPATFFEEGSVLEPPDCAPYSTIEPLVEDLSEASEVVVVTPVLITPYIEILADESNSPLPDVCLTVNERVASVLESNDVKMKMDDVIAQNQLSISDTIPRYGIVLIDERITYILIFSSTNHLSAAIRNDRPDAIAWARERIDEIVASERTTESNHC
jgi:predicted transcriptional regulator